MICVSISEPGFTRCMALVRQYDFVEIRLDGADFTLDQIQQLFQEGTKTIATFRPGRQGDNHRAASLKAAIQAGANMVDIEAEALQSYREDLLAVARKNACAIIISSHNCQETPDISTLQEILGNCYKLGADIAKIACQVNHVNDATRLISLHEMEGRKIVIGMGDQGRFTRIAGFYFGSEFCYAFPDNSRGTAPGQISYSAMSAILQSINQNLL